MSQTSVRHAQAPLRAQYKSSPQSARITDHARTAGKELNDPFHSIVEPMPGCGVAFPVGVHSALGGMHDAPTPGDILCAALASCQDSAVRMVANLLGVELEGLEVEVAAEVDVRGAMAVDQQVPVGFQSMRCDVRLHAKAGTDPALLEQLRLTSERCCVVLQTLRRPPPVQTVFHM